MSEGLAQGSYVTTWQLQWDLNVSYSLIGQAPARGALPTLPTFVPLPFPLGASATLVRLSTGLLHVPFAHTSTMQNLSFSVVGPLVWNSLPLALRSLPRVFSQKFLRELKTTLFGRAGVGSASE